MDTIPTHDDVVLWVFWTSPAWQPQCHPIPIIRSSTSCPELSHVRVCHWWAPSTSEACVELEVFSWTKAPQQKCLEFSSTYLLFGAPWSVIFCYWCATMPVLKEMNRSDTCFLCLFQTFQSNNIRQLAYLHLFHSFPTHNRTKLCSSRCWKSALAMAKASIRLMGSCCARARKRNLWFLSCRGDKLVVYLTWQIGMNNETRTQYGPDCSYK